MEKETQVALLILVTTITVWRLSRYLRLGLSRSRRHRNLGVAGGWVPRDPDPTVPSAAPASSAPARSSLYARIVGMLMAAGAWIAINALLWYGLLEVPPFKDLPPILVGVAGIFANFYVIPLAQKAGIRIRQRIEEARVGTAPSAP